MRPVTDFHARLLPYAVACPDPMAYQALVDSAVHFCHVSKVLRVELDPVTTTAGQSNYTLDAPTGMSVSRVTRVVFDNTPVHLLAAEDRPISSFESNGNFYASVGTDDSEVFVTLHPAPKMAGVLAVEAVVVPLRNATQLADELYNKWCEPIVYGALARILAVPAQPFTDPVSAQMYAQKAFVETSKARIEGQFHKVQSTRRIAPNRFA